MPKNKSVSGRPCQCSLYSLHPATPSQGSVVFLLKLNPLEKKDKGSN